MLLGRNPSAGPLVRPCGLGAVACILSSAHTLRGLLAPSARTPSALLVAGLGTLAASHKAAGRVRDNQRDLTAAASLVAGRRWWGWRLRGGSMTGGGGDAAPVAAAASPSHLRRAEELRGGGGRRRRRRLMPSTRV